MPPVTTATTMAFTVSRGFSPITVSGMNLLMSAASPKIGCRPALIPRFPARGTRWVHHCMSRALFSTRR